MFKRDWISKELSSAQVLVISGLRYWCWIISCETHTFGNMVLNWGINST